jgi:hypothetical protein
MLQLPFSVDVSRKFLKRKNYCQRVFHWTKCEDPRRVSLGRRKSRSLIVCLGRVALDSPLVLVLNEARLSLATTVVYTVVDTYKDVLVTKHERFESCLLLLDDE